MPVTAADGDADWLYPRDMTLAEAIELLTGPSWACACIGPGPGAPAGAPCPCAVVSGHARDMQRAAHIAADLVAQVVTRRAVGGLTVGGLRAALAGLPDAMPVAVLDDLSVDPAGSVTAVWWRYAHGWGVVSADRDRESDGELIGGDTVPVRAVVISSKDRRP